VNVARQSNNYPVWSKADWFRVEDTTRAPGDEAKAVELGVSCGTYFADNYAAKARLLDEEMANSDLGWGATLQSKTELATSKLWLDWEDRLATLALTDANVWSVSAVASAWGTANATPFTTLSDKLLAIHDNTGYRPNRLLMGYKAWELFRRSGEVKDLLYPHGGGIAGQDQAASLLEVDQVLVGRALKNTAAEGQSATMSALWGAEVIAYYAPSAPSLDQPSWGYTFRWNGPNLPAMTAQIHPYNSVRHAQEVEIGVHQDEKITATEMAYKLTAVDSST